MGDFMGKRVNMFMLLMVIFVLVGMGALSIYYQRTFKDLNSDFTNTSESLGVCRQELSQTSTVLANTLSNLNSTESDIRKYDTLYEQKAAELEKKKDELAQTQTKLQTETLFKEQFKRQAETLSSQNRILNQTIINLRRDIAAKESEIEEWIERAACLRQREGSEENSCY